MPWRRPFPTLLSERSSLTPPKVLYRFTGAGAGDRGCAGGQDGWCRSRGVRGPSSGSPKGSGRACNGGVTLPPPEKIGRPRPACNSPSPIASSRTRHARTVEAWVHTEGRQKLKNPRFCVCCRVVAAWGSLVISPRPGGSTAASGMGASTKVGKRGGGPPWQVSPKASPVK